MLNKPSIGITIGDPSGIGPEVTLKAISRLTPSQISSILVIGDGNALSRVAGLRKIKFELIDLKNIRGANFAFGKISPIFGRCSVEYLEKYLELFKRKSINALVTAPISKEAINLAGFKFPGHTEFLAKKTNTRKFAMMFVAGKLKVALVTRHISLSEVPREINQKKISDTIILTVDFLKKYYRLKSPRIALCGLNPHAGEDGLLGKEEDRIIKPAIAKAKSYAKFIFGPLSSDTVFLKSHRNRFDAIIAMYHDQGMIPVKTLSFDTAVNVTLGLPFVRTSPCHGTAFDIAGKNIANPYPMLSAIQLAISLSKKSLC